LYPDSSVTGRRGKEAPEIALYRRIQIEDLVDRIVAGTAEPKEQRVRRHRARIPMAALVLVEGVAGAPIIALPTKPHDLEPFLRQAQAHQVRGDLVFDPSPHFVGVDKWQGKLSTFRPGAKEQPAFVAARVSGPLRIRII